MPITQSITVLPTPPSRADPENFDTRADAFLGALPTMQTQMNTWAGQANSTASDATSAAGTATTQAGTATTQAGIATTQAGIATTQAGIATTQAGTATTQAGIATTQAGTATTQAGIATTQAGIATTQAGIATTKAGEAAASAALAVDVVSGGLVSVTPAANKIPMADSDGEIALGWLDLTGYAPAAKGVTNGDSHDHNGGDGAQIAYSSLSGLPTLGTAAATASTDYAPAAKGVTNGDSHDHNGGDGAQIAYSSLSGTPTLGTAAAAATTDFAAASHAHGNITAAGAIGSTANLPLITTTGGAVTVGAFGTGATNFCVGNDARLSDARTPTAHNQAETTITFTDVSTGNASTTAHGFAPKATAPASGLRSVLAIDNGETVRSDKALFDATNPAALGTASPGSAMTAARRDHVHALPALGKILQVVMGTRTTRLSLNTQTYTDLDLSVSITPSAASSKVLVFATLPGVWIHGPNATSAVNARLRRDSTTLVTYPYIGYLPEMITILTFCYLDSPSSTSAVTYSMQGACSHSGDLVTFMDSNEISTIVAMEVAA